MNEREWLTSAHVGSMLRHLTHETHVAEDAIGDHRRAVELISQRQVKLFDEACWLRYGLTIDDVAVQTVQPDGAADLLRDIRGNPFRPIDFDEAWRSPTVLAVAKVAYEERAGRARDNPECHLGRDHSIRYGDICTRCHGTGRIEDGALDPFHLSALADALVDAGCPEEARWQDDKGGPLPDFRGPNPLLAHLRSPGPHVRGCWALDLVLGKG